MGKQNFSGLLSKIQNNKIAAVVLNHRLFLYCYFVVCMVLALPPIANYVSALSYVCFLWAVLLICWDILTTRRLFKMVYWALPLLFLCSYAISVLLNANHVLVSGCKHLVHCAIAMLLIYEVNATSGKEEILKTLKKMCTLLIISVSLANLVALFLYVSGFSEYRIGLWENRLFGIYYSPNSGAILTILAIVAAILKLSFLGKINMLERVALIFSIVVQTIYFALTLSKGGDLAVIFLLLVYVIVYVFFALRKKFRVIPAVLLSIVGFALCMGIYYGAMGLIREEMSYAPVYYVQLKNANKTPVDTDVVQPTAAPTELPTDASVVQTEPAVPAEPTVPAEPSVPVETLPPKVEFERVEEHSDISNNRFAMWSGCLSVMDQAPFFGFADMAFDGDIPLSNIELHENLDENNVKWLRIANGYLHNSYVQVLGYSGGVGLLIFLLFAVMVVKYVLTILFCGNKYTRDYSILAILFSVSAMLALNGFVESHLLFNRQDVIGFLFWYLLGTTVVLAKEYRYDADFLPENKGEKGALIAATPLQVLHCVEFVANNIEESAGSTDLYVVHSFRDAKGLAERVRKSGMFCNVYELQPRTIKNSLQSKLFTFCDLFFPEQALAQKNCGPKFSFIRKNYKFMAASSATTFTIGMHMAFPKAKVYLYDDGIGSYYGSMVDDYNSTLFKLMDKLFFNGSLSMQPEAMYISSPELSLSTTACDRRKLPGIDESGNVRLKEIFDYHENSLYHDHKLVYLTQPFEGPENADPSVELSILDHLKLYQNDVICRVHPRQADVDFGGLLKDNNPNLWELECMQQISNESVLISWCSTAQFMPKLLCDLEPHIIFTYKLFGSNINGDLGAFVDSFKSLYRDKDRIMIPDTMDEFEEMLRKVCESK